MFFLEGEEEIDLEVFEVLCVIINGFYGMLFFWNLLIMWVLGGKKDKYCIDKMIMLCVCFKFFILLK